MSTFIEVENHKGNKIFVVCAHVVMIETTSIKERDIYSIDIRLITGDAIRSKDYKTMVERDKELGEMVKSIKDYHYRVLDMSAEVELVKFGK